jgi:hypothetical protein
MGRPPDRSPGVADVFRAHGAAWRKANAGHVSLGQLKVMSAIETCRTAALGGHVERCEDCAHERVAYNSCRNRHCPKCQGAAARLWLAEREAELLPVPYYHVVFTLPASIGAIASHNKAAVYDLLFRTAAETLIAIAADPKHLGARIGLTAVLHTWGSALTHHPHVHVIVPGGGLAPDGARWITCKPGFFLPVRVLSRLFRRLFLEGLAALNQAGRLAFFGDLAPLADKRVFDAALAPLRRSEWIVFAKRPFAGPQAVLAYLARYTHRVAISNSRLITLDDKGITFNWKDYRIKGRDRLKTMTLDAAEFIRRFLLHVLPSGFHRIRHYGLFAGTVRARNIERARQALAAPKLSSQSAHAEANSDAETPSSARRCPCCGGRMIIVETFEGRAPRVSPRQSRSGSTPHDDCRGASRLATPFLLASGRAPEQQDAVFNSSALLLQASRSRSTLAGFSAKKLVVFFPAAKYPRRQPPKSHERFVRDLKNPHRPRPTNQRPSSPRFPPWEAFERRPTARTTVSDRAGVRNPSPLLPFKVDPMNGR